MKEVTKNRSQLIGKLLKKSRLNAVRSRNIVGVKRVEDFADLAVRDYRERYKASKW